MMRTEPLISSNQLLGSTTDLRQQLAATGYLYLRDIVDHGHLRQLRAEILDIFGKYGWLDAAYPKDEARTNAVPTVEGEDAYFEVYDEVQRLETLHSLPHRPEVLSVMKQAVGETTFPHPLGVARLSFPNNEECTTPPHQDYPNNQGTEELYACWIPLSDCPVSLGGVSILKGSHKLGLMPLDYSLGAGGRQARLSEAADALPWLTGDFLLGDVLIFGSMTIHRALPNLSGDQFRLSVDYRYQEEHQPLTPPVLEPHFGRMSWPEIYAGWKSKELQYYWKDKQFSVTEWNNALHELPADHMQEALRLARAYNRRRDKIRQNKSS
jgi:ectoine hydroxylase-related dioxygenase (phytanoyl-CoA dioxygenase family)